MTKKKHLYEVDLMRRFFMFGVVLNHVASTFAAALGNKATPAGRFLVSTHLILRLIAGLEAPTVGEITMNGQKLSGLNQQARGMFQDDRLLPWNTVLGNLLMPGNDPDKAKRLLGPGRIR